MKKHIIKRKMIGFALVGLVLCSGCGTRSNEAEIAASLTEHSGNGEGNSTATLSDASEISFTDQENTEIPSHLQFSLEQDKCEFVVAAEVSAAGYNQMSVYSEKRFSLSDEELDSLAKSIFDNGQYEVCKPYFMMTRDELETEEKQYFELAREADTAPGKIEKENLNEYINPFVVNEIGNCLTILDRHEDILQTLSYETELTDGKLIYRSKLFGRSEARLKGMVDGKNYELFYEQSTGSLVLKPMIEYSEKYGANWEIIPLGETDEATAKETAENACNYLVAKVQADTIVEKLMEGEWKLQALFSMGYIHDGVFKDDGYKFVYTRQLQNGCGIVSEYNATSFELMYSKPAYSFNTSTFNPFAPENENRLDQEYMTVIINSDGLIFSGVFSGLVENKILQKSVEMLSFDRILDIAKEYGTAFLEHSAEQNKNETTLVTNVFLSYLSVVYDNELVRMPFWVFWDDSDFCTVCFGINAINGDIVELMYSLSEYNRTGLIPTQVGCPTWSSIPYYFLPDTPWLE